MKRVVVTGRGVVCSIGNSVREFTSALSSGDIGIRPLEGIPVEGLQIKIGAQVKAYEPEKHFSSTQLNLLDRASQFALLAASQAMEESGLNAAGGLGPRSGVVVGSGAGGATSVEALYMGRCAEPNRRAHPMTVPRVMFNAPASHISMTYGVTGPSFMVATACASSATAISQAHRMIRSGEVDIVIVGGTEACVTEGYFKAWEALRVMSPDTCRPFSKGRLGLVLGEGAAMFVLESLDHAQARGATIYGEIAGTAMNSDAGHILNPSLERQVEAIRQCLKDSELTEESVGYVNAHGTATYANDATETRGLHTVFGEHARQLLVSSTKSMHGHTLGAAGALELLATLIAVEDGFAPPTMNYTEACKDCDLNYVPNEALQMNCNAAISSSFAFGGHNAVVAVRSSRAM